MLSVRPIVSTLAVALVLTAASAVHAQATAPAAPTVTPSPNCDKPGDPPAATSSEIAKAASDQKRVKWSAGMKTYLECLKKFVEQQQATSATAAKAANAGVEEYNRAIKVFNEQIQAAPQ